MHYQHKESSKIGTKDSLLRIIRESVNRKNGKITQKELAKRAGVAQSQLSNFINGKCEIVDIDKISKILEIVGSKIEIVKPSKSTKPKKSDFEIILQQLDRFSHSLSSQINILRDFVVSQIPENNSNKNTKKLVSRDDYIKFLQGEID